MNEREYIFGKVSGNGYLYCMHCERVYKSGNFKHVMTSEMDDVLQMCPYEGCTGDAVINAIDWKDVKEHHAEYPEEPELNKIYPLN